MGSMVTAVRPWAKLTLWIGALLIAGATNGYGQEDKAAPLTLEDAIRDGNVSAVKRLVDAGADVNEPELLSLAVMGSVDVLELLVDAGADVNLAIPVPPDKKEIVLETFGSNAEVVAGTPLAFAALRGRTEVVGLLLEEGAEPNVLTAAGTPVAMAADRGHTEVLKLLVEAGADAAGRTPSGTAAVMFSPLLLAAKAGNFDAVELLVEYGGYRCPDGSTFTLGDIIYRAQLDQILKEAGNPELTALMDRAKEACGVK